jgi:MFS family permease
LAATILGSSMAFIDGTVVNVALPALQEALHATVVDVQWVVESYALFLAALMLNGRIARRPLRAPRACSRSASACSRSRPSGADSRPTSDS